LTLSNGIINAVANYSSPITKAIYICNDKFTLIGDNVRYCQTNGTNWTGKDSTCGKNNIQW